MTRLISHFTWGALVGLALLGGACQGELKLNNAGGGAGPAPTGDMAMPPVNNDEVSFFQINKDIEQPALNCSAPIGACHGTDMPKGILKLLPNATASMDSLRANYLQVKARSMAGAESTMLTKPLATRMDVKHEGSKTYFKNENDTTYKYWLQWIVCGAKFDPVKVKDCPTVMNPPPDMAGGG